MPETDEKLQLEQFGFSLIDKNDRRLSGSPIIEDLLKEPHFTPIEFKGYIFLLVLTQSKQQNMLLDIVSQLQPFLAKMVDLNEKKLEKTGLDLTGYCHGTSEKISEEVGGEVAYFFVREKRKITTVHGHSIVRVQLQDKKTMVAFDPTQPSIGQHDPLNPETYQLREAKISPLIIVGSSDEVATRIDEYYDPAKNPFKEIKQGGFFPKLVKNVLAKAGFKS